MRNCKTAAILYLLILAFVVGLQYFTLDDRQPQPNQVEQLQAEVQQLRADNKKLTERVDANDLYINHQLMMEGDLNP